MSQGETSASRVDKKQGDAQKGALLSLPSRVTSGRSLDQWLSFYLKRFPLHGSNWSGCFIHVKSFNLGRGWGCGLGASCGRAEDTCAEDRGRGLTLGAASWKQALSAAHPWPSPGACGGGAVNGRWGAGPAGRPHSAPGAERGSVPSGHTHAERHERPAPSSLVSAPIALRSLPSPSHVRSH